MLRLCSESLRSYTPQGGTELSPGRSVRLYNLSVRPLVKQAWVCRIGDVLYERMSQRTGGKNMVHFGVIPGVIGQKSAEAIGIIYLVPFFYPRTLRLTGAFYLPPFPFPAVSSHILVGYSFKKLDMIDGQIDI